MYKARKEQSSKSHSRKLSQILMKKGRFSGLKPIYLLNHSFWLYTCHTFSESCVKKEDHGIKKWYDLTLPNLRIHSPFLHPNYSSRCNGNHPKQSSWCKQFLDLKQSSRCDQFWFPCPSDATACGKSGQSVDYCSYKRSPLSAIRSRAKNGVLLFCFGK